MIANGVIDQDLKILISTNCESDTIRDDNIDFVTINESKCPSHRDYTCNNFTENTQSPYKLR